MINNIIIEKKYNLNNNTMTTIINPITNRKIQIKTLSKRLRSNEYNRNQIKLIQERLQRNNLGFNQNTGRISKSNNKSLKIQLNKERIQELAVKKITNAYIKYYKNKNTSYIVDNEGNIGRLNKNENNPLILQEFGIDNIQKYTNPQIFNNMNIKFKTTLDNDKEYNLRIAFKFEIKYSSEWLKKNGTIDGKYRPNQIQNAILNYIGLLYGIDTNEPETIRNVELLISSPKTNQKFDLDNMELRDSNPIDISNIYNEVILNKQGNCIQNYLGKIYHKFSKKELIPLKTINDLINYSIKHDIKLVAYDITGKVIASNYPTKKNKSRKSMIFIAYNNHYYPLKNEVLNKVKISFDTDIKPQYYEKLDVKFKDIIRLGYLPSNLTLDYEECISSFIHNNIQYHNNKDYDKCKEILYKFGLIDHLNIFVNFKNIGDIISKLYIKQNINSFLPDNNQYCKGGYNYSKDVLRDEEPLVTMDKNKCYSYILKSLEELIHCDIKTDRLKIYNKSNQPSELINHHLYIVNPQYSSILLPSKNIYTGKHLKFCSLQNLQFTILEEQEANITENYYKDMINDLYTKIDEASFKIIINVMIGKFEKYSNHKINYAVDKICNEDELSKSESCYSVKLTGKLYDNSYTAEADDLYAVLKPKDKFDLFNKKPISIQIKDASRVLLYNMMKKLNLKFEDIIQIKTDSITFINKNDDKYMKYISKNINDWKLEEYHPIQSSNPINLDMSFKYEKTKNKNILGNCYAGCGKTHKIINEYLKNEDIVKDYIVLTPSHSTLKAYRKKGLNCSVIQTYTLNNKLPTQQNIIIDEIGMIDKASWNLIFKCHLLEKNIIGYGDKRQLLPVGCNTDLFHKNFINRIFYLTDNMNDNYRNEFTKSYYDSLIKSTNKQYLIDQCLKYNTDYKKACVIIAYRNSTREFYNQKMCELNNITSKIDIGAELICITNNLRDYKIYNKFCLKVISRDGDEITLTDGDIIIKLKEHQINKNFDYGYCRTLYSVQGESLSSYHYCEEDKYFIDNRTAYTLISRLKTK